MTLTLPAALACRQNCRFMRPWSDGTTGLRFTELEFVQRLAALEPPPHINMVLYRGVLAPCAAWRDQVAPAPPPPKPSRGRLTQRNRSKRADRARRRWPCCSTALLHSAAPQRVAPALARPKRRQGGVDGFRCLCSGDRIVVRAVVVRSPVKVRVLRGLDRAAARAPPARDVQAA